MSQLNILRVYREAEVRGAELLQRLLHDSNDAKMVTHLTWQLADEARHIQMLTELICDLGGAPILVHKKALPARCSHHLPVATLETLSYLYAAEARLQQHYRAHATRRGEDPRIVATLHTLVADEEWHLAGVEALLLRQEKVFGCTRVAATLDYYWNLVRHA